ncbi:hypothetical protein [Rickettsiella endosymbiont of Dermanyssus gallinae]|uniref:hypothetical protein n=1 Tax=Rickettsiella endosymbiont of Dermanyssus gallinae TaxID=2856608 RepID=UPI001C5309E4|nr:hypothetical protein [Rickettsiella endosymbiont of Dermanyssus gallinae]
MDMETKEASIAEEIHNVISAIKTFIKRIVDFLVPTVSNIGGKNPGLSETNSLSFFPRNDSEDDTATPSHRSPTLNTA